MNILITGGAGYIGSELVKYFIDDHKITVVDNLMYDATSLLRYAGHDNFNFIREDVRNYDFMKGLLSKNDIIIPLAALVGFPLCDKNKKAAVEINYEANKWIADNKSKDQMVIYPCTNSGYGKSVDGEVVTEESPLNPVSLYGKTKVDAETVFRNTDGCTTFRLATVFGPSSRMRSDLLVNSFVLKALKEKIIVLYECKFMRNYVHLWDVCRAFEFVTKNWEQCKNGTFNMGNDSLNMNKLDLCLKIQEYMPLEIMKAEFTQDPDVRDYVVSSAKFYDKGFSCKYDLDDGIRQLVSAYSIIDSPWYANY